MLQRVPMWLQRPVMLLQEEGHCVANGGQLTAKTGNYLAMMVSAMAG